MAIQKKLDIGFKIRKIETLQFGLIQEPPAGAKLKYNAGFEFSVQEEEKNIVCIFNYRFKDGATDLMLIVLSVTFAIAPTDFSAKILKKDKFVIPKKLATHLAMLCAGTTRGALHAKTEGTPFNRYPVPTINVIERITEDIVIPF